MAPRLLPQGCWAGLQRAATTTTTITATTAATTGTAGFPSSAAPSFLLLAGRAVAGSRGVRYGWSTQPKRGSKPTRFNQVTAGLPARTTGPAAALKRREATTPVRTGLLATKRGMTGFYSKSGTRIPCTVLQLDAGGCEVVATKTRAANGYWAVQMGHGARRATATTAPLLGYYEAKGLAPKQHLAEFRVRGPEGLLAPGLALQPDWFHVGQWVDVRSQSRGFGFAGGMKRHNFRGQEASHGNSLNHRTIGTTGPSQGSGSRVMPGKKMPGRMGNERVTVQNLNVLQVDNDLGIIVVKGAVGGPKGALVHIQDAVKKPAPSAAFVEQTRAAAEARRPDAAERLQAARERHLVLQKARREGRIAQLLANGLQSEGEHDEHDEHDATDEAAETDAEAAALPPLPEAILESRAATTQPTATA